MPPATNAAKRCHDVRKSRKLLLLSQQGCALLTHGSKDAFAPACRRWAKAGMRTIRVLHSTAHRLYPCAGELGVILSAETQARYAADVEALVRLIRRCGPGTTVGNGGAPATAMQV